MNRSTSYNIILSALMTFTIASCSGAAGSAEEPPAYEKLDEYASHFSTDSSGSQSDDKKDKDEESAQSSQVDQEISQEKVEDKQSTVDRQISLEKSYDAKVKLYNKLLLSAAVGNDIDKVNLALKRGADINAVDENGSTALSLAIGKRSGKIVMRLLEKGADINQADNKGWTPLMLAVCKTYFNFDLVKTLIEHNADVNAINKNGKTALMEVALRGQHKELIDPLIEANADVNFVTKKCYLSPLFQAAGKANEQFIARLIKVGADVNFATPGGRTALLLAAQKDRKWTIEELIKAGADVDVALEKAIEINDEKAINILMKHIKVSKSSQDEDPNEVLLTAAKNGDLDKVKQALEEGANVNTVCKADKQRPLICAVRAGYDEIVKVLLENGAKVNVFDQYNGMPLYYAVKEGHGTIVAQLLAKKGIFVNGCYGDGNIELMVVAESSIENYLDIAKQLINANASVNTINKFDDTALSIAACKLREDLVTLLIDAKADLNEGFKRTIDIYNQNGAELLSKRGAEISALTKEQKRRLKEWGIRQQNGNCVVA